MTKLRIEFAPLPARAARPDPASMRAIFGGCVGEGQACTNSSDCCLSPGCTSVSCYFDASRRISYCVGKMYGF
jgi:hypothetical protein